MLDKILALTLLMVLFQRNEKMMDITEGNNTMKKQRDIIDVIRNTQSLRYLNFARRRCNDLTNDFRGSCQPEVNDLTVGKDLAEQICADISAEVSSRNNVDHEVRLQLDSNQLTDQEVEFHDSYLTSIFGSNKVNKKATMCVFRRNETIAGNQNKIVYQIVYLLQDPKMTIGTRKHKTISQILNSNDTSSSRSSFKTNATSFDWRINSFGGFSSASSSSRKSTKTNSNLSDSSTNSDKSRSYPPLRKNEIISNKRNTLARELSMNPSTPQSFSNSSRIQLASSSRDFSDESTRETPSSPSLKSVRRYNESFSFNLTSFDAEYDDGSPDLALFSRSNSDASFFGSKRNASEGDETSKNSNNSSTRKSTIGKNKISKIILPSPKLSFLTLVQTKQSKSDGTEKLPNKPDNYSSLKDKPDLSKTGTKESRINMDKISKILPYPKLDLRTLKQTKQSQSDGKEKLQQEFNNYYSHKEKPNLLKTGAGDKLKRDYKASNNRETKDNNSELSKRYFAESPDLNPIRLGKPCNCNDGTTIPQPRKQKMNLADYSHPYFKTPTHNCPRLDCEWTKPITPSSDVLFSNLPIATGVSIPKRKKQEDMNTTEAAAPIDIIQEDMTWTKGVALKGKKREEMTKTDAVGPKEKIQDGMTATKVVAPKGKKREDITKTDAVGPKDIIQEGMTTAEGVTAKGKKREYMSKMEAPEDKIQDSTTATEVIAPKEKKREDITKTDALAPKNIIQEGMSVTRKGTKQADMTVTEALTRNGKKPEAKEQKAKVYIVVKQPRYFPILAGYADVLVLNGNKKVIFH